MIIINTMTEIETPNVTGIGTGIGTGIATEIGTGTDPEAIAETGTIGTDSIGIETEIGIGTGTAGTGIGIEIGIGTGIEDGTGIAPDLQGGNGTAAEKDLQQGIYELKLSERMILIS